MLHDRLIQLGRLGMRLQGEFVNVSLRLAPTAGSLNLTT